MLFFLFNPFKTRFPRALNGLNWPCSSALCGFLKALQGDRRHVHFVAAKKLAPLFPSHLKSHFLRGEESRGQFGGVKREPHAKKSF